MCGINGITKNSTDTVRRMNEATRHRGPDATAIAERGSVTLGFNRLAIIDVSPRGMQPMTSHDGRYTIVFNGEIYNYRELKSELSGYPYTSESDTEVILAAYARWGTAAFSRLNGMFALAIHDKEKDELVLARDAVGIKPLYYHYDQDQLIFSSEIKGILAAGIAPKLNTVALSEYLQFLYVPAPETMFEGIKSLLPGKTLIYNSGEVRVEPYVAWPTTTPVVAYHDAKKQVRKTVEEAIVRQMVSDRPLGVYLSGGVDSSIVLSVAASAQKNINTYSVAFDLSDGEEREKFNADAKLAQTTAAYFGASHHEFNLSSDTALDMIEDAVYHLDQPLANATSIAQLFLARQVKPTATVVLTGEGGDELFGGYERYRLALIAERYGKYLPVFATRLHPRLRSVHLVGSERYLQLMTQKADVLNRVYRGAVTRQNFTSEFLSGTIATNLMHADERHWLVDEALMRADTMSMAASVEARVPLLDLEVRALAHALPESFKVTPWATKKILKDAFRDVLPHAVLHQPKRGFFSPTAKWLRHPKMEQFVLEATNALPDALFDKKEIRRMIDAHRERRVYQAPLILALALAGAWMRRYTVSV
ncbi:MAG: hypothetical protein RLZZ283_658 [Candidatus Parcubacteria bacterium]|jgi:asparagine synthase (glutamine-hydrolysing)